MMADKAFVDTNILLRAMIPQMAHHQEAEALIQKMWSEEIELWISRQVIREYLVQATHPNSFTPPLTVEQVMKQMEIIETLFRISDETREVTVQLFNLLQEYPTRGKQIHDANIVATMVANNIGRLLTMNVADFARFGDRVELIPLSENTL